MSFQQRQVGMAGIYRRRCIRILIAFEAIDPMLPTALRRDDMSSKAKQQIKTCKNKNLQNKLKTIKPIKTLPKMKKSAPHIVISSLVVIAYIVRQVTIINVIVAAMKTIPGLVKAHINPTI